MFALQEGSRLFLGEKITGHYTLDAVKPGDTAWFERVERFVGEIKRDGRLFDSAKRHKLEAIVVR